MPARHALVIAVDGLRASALGTYGNTWYDTPALDALAAQSTVYDWMWGRSLDVDEFYRAVWQAEPSLLRTLAAAGVHATLVSDDPAMAGTQADGFAEACRLEVSADESAPTIADTAMARVFAVAVEQLHAGGEAVDREGERAAPRLWWLHARGFYGPWDAPLELRRQLLEEDDPEAPTFLTPPSVVAPDDHDALLLLRTAYAAQAMVLDECVGALMAALADAGLDRHTLVMLVGCRGYALGEHGSVGAAGLFCETLHAPCLVRLPGVVAPPPRSADFVQPPDLGATLAAWLADESPVAASTARNLLREDEPRREFVTAFAAGGERAIRTPAWMLRRPPRLHENDEPPAPQLYAKPDDRWEANEVASRCPDVVARLLAVLDAVQTNCQTAGAIPPLDRDLIVSAR